MPGLTRVEEETLRSYGWKTIDEIRKERAAEKPQLENWQVECAREMLGHLLNRVGVPLWQFCEEAHVSKDRLQSYLDGELEDLAPQEVQRVYGSIAEIARAEAHDFERGELKGETAGQIVHRYKQQYERGEK